jgi:biotin carboxyl carrier protein
MSEYVLRIGGREYRADREGTDAGAPTVEVDGKEYRVDLVQLGRRPRRCARPCAPGRRVRRRCHPPARRARDSAPRGEGVVVAPMPGMVLGLKVKEGEKVQAGQVLLLMEAMKMENAIAAPFAGTVSRVHVREGDSVGEGDRLVDWIGRS